MQLAVLNTGVTKSQVFGGLEISSPAKLKMTQLTSCWDLSGQTHA